MRMARCAAVFATTAILLTTLAASADETREHGPFTIEEVVLQGLSGTLEVRVVEGEATRLSVTGPADAVAALEVEAAADTLRVKRPQSGRSMTVVEQVTVVTGQGASSNVVIGGSEAATGETATGEAAAPLDVVVDLPAGTRLELLGFTGEAEIGDLAAPVRLQVIDGTVRTGTVATAEFATIGQGSIEAAEVAGDLDASVTGDGRITVLGGKLDAVTVAVTGAGEVAIDAPAASAVVEMVGDGAVRLAAVASEPEVSRVGAGRFEVGPR
jgi:hypothetical protein